MTQEAICPKHGPYDASLGRCPYCERESGLPPAPFSLDDDLETDPFGGRQAPAQAAYNEEETDFGIRAKVYEDEDFTELPERRPAGWEDDETVVERAEEGMLGFLIVKEGMRRGQVNRIGNGTTIGRGEAKIILRDPKVSRPHAKFTLEDDQFMIWDFGSENGTFVNGTRIREATRLQENDVIKIGDNVFVLKILE
ncbi:MAG: FHA domain-containing protein [Chloroflexia bacterium]|nr:FHA domain-containing protein [Chloroflexia bacterium]